MAFYHTTTHWKRIQHIRVDRIICDLSANLLCADRSEVESLERLLIVYADVKSIHSFYLTGMYHVNLHYY